ncbi:hypothetical protein DYD21_17255 [Rhodohalobacter sp. SW132]|uniref:hypothetical protein n=1 Tax=Rhodohalobacter sp. SW132 TaxID=2293433 RepID=UPI000E3AE2B9|nr:hypothetical protein [Rhodohalobacter sp. SW132]REL24613.1 hypothetical protein DYD21_17255 [Rhodohalobacter sp. SW132]
MIQRIIIFCVIAISGVFVNAERGNAQHSMGARSIASGQTGVAAPGDSWSLFSNSALLSTDEKRISFYGFRYAGIAEITDAAFSASTPVFSGAAGAAVHRYGFDLFNETRFIAGYKQNWHGLHAGIALHYTYVQQGGNYGSAGAAGLDLGFAAEIISGLWFGSRATNINQPKYKKTDEELPRELAAGLSFSPVHRLMISTEIVKDVRFPASFRAGLDAELITGFRARTGITTQPETYSAGFGYQTGRWQINFAVQQHNPLGLSPAIDFGLTL